METKAEIVRHLKDVGAKYALIVAPINKQKDIIKSVCKNIDYDDTATIKAYLTISFFTLLNM